MESKNSVLYELGNASRELAVIEKGIRLVKEKEIELIIGAGGANIMDCTKLIAFGMKDFIFRELPLISSLENLPLKRKSTTAR